jgi:hypothetical protein
MLGRGGRCVSRSQTKVRGYSGDLASNALGSTWRWSSFDQNRDKQSPRKIKSRAAQGDIMPTSETGSVS